MIRQTLRNLPIYVSCLFLAAGAYAAADKPADPIAAAIGSSERPADDRSEDAIRQPAAFLAFVGVKPGWHVADMFSAGGYYTELLSRIVGPEGEVIAYNNPPYASFAAKSIVARYAGNRLSNVRQITTEVDELKLAPGSLDGVIFVKSYHDMYWRPADGAWNRTDPKVMLSKLARPIVKKMFAANQDELPLPIAAPAPAPAPAV